MSLLVAILQRVKCQFTGRLCIFRSESTNRNAGRLSADKALERIDPKDKISEKEQGKTASTDGHAGSVTDSCSSVACSPVQSPHDQTTVSGGGIMTKLRLRASNFFKFFLTFTEARRRGTSPKL